MNVLGGKNGPEKVLISPADEHDLAGPTVAIGTGGEVTARTSSTADKALPDTIEKNQNRSKRFFCVFVYFVLIRVFLICQGNFVPDSKKFVHGQDKFRGNLSLFSLILGQICPGQISRTNQGHSICRDFIYDNVFIHFTFILFFHENLLLSHAHHIH